MVVYPNAKINLGLHIVAKRPDGFHDLESVFYPVAWCDILELLPQEGGTTQFSSSGISIPGEGNLVTNAYSILAADFALPPVHFHLHKQIPIGAGMGGGSADAAFCLRALNEHFKLGLTTEQLEAYAGKLGSDCPFFIDNQPAFVSGTGDVLEPIELDLSGKYIAMIHPGIHISTPEAYQSISPRPASFDLRTLGTLPLEEWTNHVVNDFEAPLFVAYPELEFVKNQLYAAGAFYASMSGSGSTIYGLFDKQPVLNNVAATYSTFIGQL